MFLEERQESIMNMLNAEGKVRVKELSEKFGVTEDCIRKDLGSLEKQGRLKRTYGGAVVLRENNHVIEISKRKTTGVGYGEFHDNYQEKYILPEAKERYLGHAHSNFFQVLAEGGILGVAGLLAWWLSTAIYCIRGWFGSRNIGYLTFLGIFAGIMLQGMTEYTMGDSIVMKLFWFGLGMSYQWIATGMADDGDAT